MSRRIDLDRLLRPCVKSLKPYSSARDEYTGGKSGMVFLDANENPFDNGVNRYPDPHQKELKAKISEIKGVPSANIFLGNGSDEVLDLLFRAFCEPGTDNCISLPPTYGMYKVLSGINNVENREVLLRSDFQPDKPGIEKMTDANTKLLFLCSPNNPTGNLMNPDVILELLENFNGLVVIDEAYIDFSTSESWSKQLPKYKNLVVTQTLSKAYGLAGIRLGMCFASKEIIEVLNRIKPPYNVNELSQQRALSALSNRNQYENEKNSIIREKNRLLKQLLQIKYVKDIFPSEANFFLVRVDDADKRYAQLISHRIVVRNRGNQPLCKNTLRITVGTWEENDFLIKALQTI
ncbi:histidinol-phosphate transaminase [Aureitalea sp. L0-47]|uniref:histidinol-phosphate transaminase n=1 Tax=Aureitalea sp. L0-47 TaxID=2816962 RepID=UPI002237771E|nr:histidinol-phosphate transaminase [Aureitalea sp. L0-47]MCW5519492.1 histidinol-phosphate transaminase [Aureitalea sp. L0-47]